MKKTFVNDVCERAASIFDQEQDNLEGVVLAGSFIRHDIDDEIPNRFDIVRSVGTNYAGKPGVREIFHEASDIFDTIDEEKKQAAVDTFLTTLKKDEKRAVYGKEGVETALEYGAVDTLLVSDTSRFDTQVNRAESTGATVVETDIERLTSINPICATLRYRIE